MNTTTNRAATPAKLKDGTWGARVQGRAVRGDAITVKTRAGKTRAGKTWDAVIERVVWSDGSVSICSTQSAKTQETRSRSRWGSGHGQAAPVAGYSKYCTDNASCGCYDCAS